MQILGGQPLPNLYDKVNRCTINSGAFVSAVFQSGSAHFANELSEGKLSGRIKSNFDVDLIFTQLTW